MTLRLMVTLLVAGSLAACAAPAPPTDAADAEGAASTEVAQQARAARGSRRRGVMVAWSGGSEGARL